MADELSDKQVALLIALRELERDGEVVDFGRLAKQTGYSEASVRTYFTKRLEGFVAFRTDEGWRIRGAVRTTEEAFARRMSQKAASANDALKTEDSWQSLIRKLLYEGQRRRYRLSREEMEIIEVLAPSEAPRPSTEEVEIQPSLFRKP